MCVTAVFTEEAVSAFTGQPDLLSAPCQTRATQHKGKLAHSCLAPTGKQSVVKHIRATNFGTKCENPPKNFVVRSAGPVATPFTRTRTIVVPRTPPRTAMLSLHRRCLPAFFLLCSRSGVYFLFFFKSSGRCGKNKA